MADTQSTQVQATVSVPSSDLIVYRFDQADKKFDELFRKLDMLTNNFITREEAQMMKDERDAKFAEVDKKFESMQWYWRTAVAATIVALVADIVSRVFHVL